MFTIIVFAVLLVIIAFLWRYSTYNFNYWKNKHVPYEKNIPFIGSILEVLIFKKSLSQYLKDVYDRCNGPYVGIVTLTNPALIVKSPELIKRVLVHDFSYFNDRTIFNNRTVDSLSSNFLYCAKGERWQNQREQVLPVFLLGKLNKKFNAIMNCTNLMIDHISYLVIRENCFDVSAIMEKYAIDLLLNADLRVNSDSFNNETESVKNLRLAATKPGKITCLARFCFLFEKSLAELLNVKYFGHRRTKEIRTFLWDVLETAGKRKCEENDLIDVMLKLKERLPSLYNRAAESDYIIGHAMQCFLANAETLSVSITFALHELAINQNIQNKLRKEIESRTESDINLCFETINDLKYLEQIVRETLRKYPRVAYLERCCTENFNLSGRNLEIEKGTPVFISILGLHHDENLYPEPEKFDPERFNEINSQSRPFCTYLPFGEGPRRCIGETYGMLIMKLALMQIIFKFQVDVCEKSEVPIKFDSKRLFLKPANGVVLKFRSLNRS